MAGIFERIQKMWNPPDDEFDDYYEQPAEAEESTEDTGFRSPFRASQNRVVDINARTSAQVRAFQPISFGSETSEIADELNKKNIVILNLEKTDKAESRRILDFLSGVAYANEGKIKRVSTSTYLITPYNVDLMGDLIDELENSGLYF